MAEERERETNGLQREVADLKAELEILKKSFSFVTSEKLASPSVDGETKKLFSELAENIGMVANQGAGGRPKPVAPEVLMAREAGRKELNRVLTEIMNNLRRAEYERDETALEEWLPRYRLSDKVYLCEVVMEPFLPPKRPGDPPVPHVVYYSGPPNHAMIPLNPIAKRVKAAFLESVGGGGVQLGAVTFNDPTAARDGSNTVVQDNRDYFMTHNGQVVRGVAPRSAFELEMPGENEEVRRNNPRVIDPTERFVHILGTVHPPADQKTDTWSKPLSDPRAAMGWDKPREELAAIRERQGFVAPKLEDRA